VTCTTILKVGAQHPVRLRRLCRNLNIGLRLLLLLLLLPLSIFGIGGTLFLLLHFKDLVAFFHLVPIVYEVNVLDFGGGDVLDSCDLGRSVYPFPALPPASAAAQLGIQVGVAEHATRADRTPYQSHPVKLGSVSFPTSEREVKYHHAQLGLGVMRILV
jgi:hypothetical protein